jgi:hypothetical protein
VSENQTNFSLKKSTFMKRIFTIRINITASASFLLKGFMLSLFCIMLPGCVNTMNGSANVPALQSMQKGANILHVNDPVANNNVPVEKKTTRSNEESSNESKTRSLKSPDTSRFPERSTTPLTPDQAPEREEHFHDIEEEKVMCINFSAKMRLSIVMLLATFIFYPLL